MLNKKLMILTIILVSLLAVSAVSAADNATSDVVSVDQTNVEIAGVCAADANDTMVTSEDNLEIDKTTDDVIGVEEDTNLTSNEENEILTEGEQTFAQLNTIINGNTDNDIYLNGNYKYSSGDDSFKKGIVINRDVNIYGNGVIIDGNNQARIFQINRGNVVLYNITFINGNSDRYGDGGAVYFERGSCIVVNCTFSGNTADYHGGAVYFDSGSGSVVNCTFSGNTANQYGGAVYFDSGSGSVVNCSFVGNSAGNSICAVYFGGSGSVLDCSFVGNSAWSVGTVYFKNGGSVVNCSFVGNSAEIMGGAVLFERGSGSVVNCTFSGNTAYQYGGAVYFYSGGSVVNCTFIKNSVIVSRLGGGAVYFDSGGSVVNCTFSGNTANRDGGAVYFGGSGSVLDCSFVGNSAGTSGGAIYVNVSGSAVNCTFKRNSAKQSGNAIYNVNATECSFENYDVNRDIEGGSTTNCNFTIGSFPIDFDDIGDSIEYAGSGDILILSGNYYYIGSSHYHGENIFSGFKIDKSLTFIGKDDATIEGFNNVKLFNIVSGNVTFRDITFKNFNGYGDVIYSNSNVTFYNCKFINNSARDGGAVYFKNGGSVVNCTFINNSVGESRLGGGAVFFSSGGSVVNCSFVGNSAGLSGGAVYFYRSGSVVNCSFVGNSAGRYDGGGAVHFSSGGSVVNCTFSGNSARDGGAVHFDSGGSVVNCSFVGNSAGTSGGAVSGSGSVVNCSFADNTASYNGGAVYFSSGSVVNCSFVGNSAGSSGGAVYFSSGSVVNCSFVGNSAKNYGGAVYFRGGSGSVVNCSFVGNSAGGYDGGGAVYFVGSGSVVNCSFTNNTATNGGGAVYFDSGGSVVDCSFVNNSAGTSGGAVSGSGSVVNCSFVGNSAGSSGGAVYFSSGSVVNCSFVGNSAKNYGGAVYFRGGSGSVVDCSFVNNSAVGAGAVYFGGSGSVADCKFIDNFAKVKGGAIFWSIGDSGSVNITYCSFVNCTSGDGSGCLAYREGSYYVSDCLFDVPPVGIIYSETFNPIIQVNDLSIYNGEDGILTVHLYDIRGPLAGKTVTLTVNNNYYDNGTDSEGFTSFNIKDYLNVAGNFTVGVGFAGEGLDNPAFRNVTVLIKRHDSILAVNNVSAHVGENAYLNVSLFDANGMLSGKTVVLTVNGKRYAKSTSDGVASFNVKDYITKGGNYDVTLAFEGDEYNAPISANARVVLIRYDPVITVDNVSVYVGEDCIIRGNFYDEGGRLFGKQISFNFKNKKITKTTNYNGEFSLDVISEGQISEIGEYNISANFAGDDWDNPYSFVVNVKIKKYDSILSVNDMTIFNDEEGILRVNLSDIHGVLINRTVIFSVNGQNYTNRTDDNGSILFDVKGYLNGEGNYSIGIIFEGDDLIESCSAVSNVIILRYESILKVNNLTCVSGSDAFLVADLSDSHGVMFNRTVVFNINGENHSVKTDDMGRAVFNVKDYLNPGNNVVGVGFSGDDYIRPSSANAYVHLNNYEGLLSVSQMGSYYDDTILKFTLIDLKDGKGISDASLKIEFGNGEVAYLKTDSKGVATYDVPFAPGRYNATASVSDDNVDVNDVAISDIVINSIEGVMKVTQVDRTNVLNVRVYNPSDGHQYRNINVTLKFNHIDPVYVVTNDEGVAVYSMDFDYGTYSVFASVNKPYTNIGAVSVDDIVIKEDNSYATVTFSSGIVFEYGASGSIYVTVKGGSIEEENIKVLNHPEARITLVKNVITVSNLDPGLYTLSVVSTPFGDFKAGNGTVSINVRKATAVIKAQKITVALKKGSKWTITLVNSKTGKPIGNMKLTLKVYTGKKYKTVSVTTNSNGVASYQTKGLSKGTHKVVVSAVDGRYDFNTLTSSIKVVKQKALKFKVKKKIAKDGSSLSITVKYKNKPINGVKLKVMVYDGKKLVKTVTLKTKTKGKYKGVAGWGTNKLKVGNHKIVIMPASIQYGGSKSLKMKIKKSAKKYPKWETKI